MRLSRRFSGTLLIGGLAVAPAACGSSGASTGSGANAGAGASTGGSTQSASGGTEPSAALLKEAQQEGQVVFYSALNPSVEQELGSAFKAKYGITLAWKEDASGATIQTASAQLDAGNVQMDVISITPDPKFQDKYNPDFLDFSPQEMPALHGMPGDEVAAKSIQYFINYYGWFYNTDALKESDMPSDLYGLAIDPALKGKIATPNIAASNSYVTYYAMLYDAWGAAKLSAWMKNLLQNQHAMVGTSSAALANDAASGAVDVFGPTALGPVEGLIKQGAPLAIKYYTPTIRIPTLAISFAKAPHPAAAKVFVNWLVTKQAQEIICGGSLCSSYLNLADAIQQPQGVTIVEAPIARGVALSDTLTSIFKSAEP